MAISRVAGQMLQSNLLRDGIDIAFDTTLLYLDVNGNAVGINTSSPGSALEVAGVLKVGNVTISNIGNISAGNININNLATPVANADAATKFYVDSRMSNIGTIGNLTVSNTTISANIANANIFIDPPGIGQFQIVGTNGFVMPVGNTAEQPGSPATGTLRFNSETVQLEVYDGTQWAAATNNQSVITNQTITPDGINDTYALNQAATADSILVTINGISQTPTIDYTVSAGNITFTTTPLTTDIIQIRFIASTVATSAAALPNYTVAQAANIGSPGTGQLIYVSNGANGSPCVAVYSDSAWKRINLAGNISAT